MPVIPIGSVEISSYALMVAIAASVAFWLTFREIERKQLDPAIMVPLVAIAFLSSLVGARGLAWMLHPEIYRGEGPSALLTVWDRGGMAMYGGIALAGIVGGAYAAARGVGLWEVADTLVAAWVPFIVLVRIGCFLNGCCYGKPTTSIFGMVAGGSPNNVNFGIPSHPTQLYDAAAALVIFVFLWRLRLRRTFAGQVAVTFLIAYPLFRFFHEFLRGDPRTAWQFGSLGTLSVNQIVSVGLIAFALVAGFLLERRSGARTSAGDARATT